MSKCDDSSGEMIGEQDGRTAATGIAGVSPAFVERHAVRVDSSRQTVSEPAAYAGETPAVPVSAIPVAAVPQSPRLRLVTITD